MIDTLLVLACLMAMFGLAVLRQRVKTRAYLPKTPVPDYKRIGELELELLGEPWLGSQAPRVALILANLEGITFGLCRCVHCGEGMDGPFGLALHFAYLHENVRSQIVQVKSHDINVLKERPRGLPTVWGKA